VSDLCADAATDLAQTTQMKERRGSNLRDVLGPLLFLLYANHIQNYSIESCIKLFANDTNVFEHFSLIFKYIVFAL